MSGSWTAVEIPPQTGRTVVVTGATSGLGLESALALARAGALVVLAARNEAKAARVLASVAEVATGPGPEVVRLDLADLASVRAAADELRDRLPAVDVLMNNAGVMAMPRGRTPQGFETQAGTNHFGPFALTGLLLPLLLAAPEPRVVTTSSQMHRFGRIRWDDLHWEQRYRKWPAYSQSKLANLLFTMELDRRAAAAGSPLVSVAAHPGYAATHLQAGGPEAAGAVVFSRIMEWGNRVLAQSATDGALPQLYAATMPSVRGGDYFGPSRLGEMRGAPTLVRPTAAALDVGSARRLWDVSEHLTGVTYDWSGARSPG